MVYSVLLILSLCISCNTDNDTEVFDDNNLTLLKSENKVLRNQDIIFQLFDEENDITQSAVFYVNDTPIQGNKFSSSDGGTFEVSAELDKNGQSVRSLTDFFEVYIPIKKALIEGFTGTWCGNCPSYDILVERAIDSIQDLVVVSVHGGSEDPYTTEEGMILKDYFNSPGYPTGYIDRGPDYWSNYIVNLYPLDEVTPFAVYETDISIKIESQLKDNKLSAQVKVVSENEIANTKLVVFLLEDGVLYDQVNYSNEDPRFPSYQMGDPIIDFEHNHIFRS